MSSHLQLQQMSRVKASAYKGINQDYVSYKGRVSKRDNEDRGQYKPDFKLFMRFDSCFRS
jgi:hypothetical protein